MPSRMMGMIYPRLIPGSLPSARQVSRSSRMEAIRKRVKAAEKGWMSLATTRPAMKVPPQKTAMSTSLT